MKQLFPTTPVSFLIYLLFFLLHFHFLSIRARDGRTVRTRQSLNFLDVVSGRVFRHSVFDFARFDQPDDRVATKGNKREASCPFQRSLFMRLSAVYSCLGQLLGLSLVCFVATFRGGSW